MKRTGFLGAVASCAIIGATQVDADASPRLAIAIEADNTVDAISISRMQSALAGRLLRTGKFQIVDRSRLDAVIREQGFSNSSYADPKTAAAIGKLAGASRILTVTLSLEANQNAGAFISTSEVDLSASFSLVGVDTGRIINAGTAQGSGQRQGPVGAGTTTSEAQLEREAVDTCADDLVSQLQS